MVVILRSNNCLTEGKSGMDVSERLHIRVNDKRKNKKESKHEVVI